MAPRTTRPFDCRCGFDARFGCALGGHAAVSIVRRAILFYRRHGLRSTVARCLTASRRSMYFGRMVLFSCPLPLQQLGVTQQIKVERVNASSLLQNDYERMLNDGDPAGRARELSRRFAAGSELWLAKLDGQLAGFGWTLKGGTIEPHFFPLLPDDVHLFDFYVYPEFRGRGFNIALLKEILDRLSQEKVRHAHIECAAWNQAQLRSLKKTPFLRYGEATQFSVFGRTVVIWRRTAV